MVTDDTDDTDDETLRNLREAADASAKALAWYEQLDGPRRKKQRSKPSRALIDGAVKRAKAEILESLPEWGACLGDAGRPWPIQSFSDLHNWCDANELGGLCEDSWQVVDDEPLPDGWWAGAREVQNRVDAWIKAGGLRAETVDSEADMLQCSFWEMLAARFPSAKTGDLDPGSSARFTQACREAIEAWMSANIPGWKGGEQ